MERSDDEAKKSAHGVTIDVSETPSNSKGFRAWISSITPIALSGSEQHCDHDGAVQSPHDPGQAYLVGLRGCLVIMSFLWVFLETFVPAAVKGSSNETGPRYQNGLRILSVIFWNDELIYSSIIFLSARTICLPFLLDPSKTQLASSAFRRGIKLWIPTAAALILVYIVFTKCLGGNEYLATFAEETGNHSVNADLYIMPSSLANFNSIFNVFWTTHSFSFQAGNFAFPSQTLWIISALFQQSYTVYVAQVIVPYTRTRWRVVGAISFILSAWWVYSWAWFSITALLVADGVTNMNLRGRLRSSLPFVRLPGWALAVPLLAAGLAMQFIWVAARPDLANAELMHHTSPYNTAGLYTTNDTTTPHKRADIFLIIVGFHLVLERFNILQRVFSNTFLLYLGRRSFSWFLLQSTIIYSLGIKLVSKTMDGDLNRYPRASGLAFIVCLLVTAPAAEIFYWSIDRSAQLLAKFLFNWIRD